MTNDVRQSCPMCNGPLCWSSAGPVEAQVCLDVQRCGWEDQPKAIVHPGPPHVAVHLRLKGEVWRPAVTLYGVLWADDHCDFVRKEGDGDLTDTMTRTSDSPAVRAVRDWEAAQQQRKQQDDQHHAA